MSLIFLEPSGLILTGLLLCYYSASVSAHVPDDSYLFLEHSESTLELEWDISYNDLNSALSLGFETDEEISTEEIDSVKDEILEYTLERLSFQVADQPCQWKVRGVTNTDYTSGKYLTLNLQPYCPRIKNGGKKK